MWFSIGAGELVLVACLAVAAAIMGARVWRWTVVALVCGVMAAMLSPADPLSTVLLAVVFCLFFLGGSRLGRSHKTASE